MIEAILSTGPELHKLVDSSKINEVNQFALASAIILPIEVLVVNTHLNTLTRPLRPFLAEMTSIVAGNHELSRPRKCGLSY